MTKFKKVALITLIGAGLATATFAWASDCGGERGRHHGGQRSHHMGSPIKHYRHADLSSEQKQQMKTIFQTAREKIKPNREKIRPLYQQLEQLSQAQQYDASAVAGVAKQMAALKQANIETMTYAKHQAWQVLTIEQQQEVKASEEKHRERMQNHREDYHN
ncbi:MAG: hypothetical protein CSA79_00970 [Thiothrix nivea]|nr:MAG: hypothetical protein CSA79_00970 [Thiothrix nivea]